MTKCIDCTKLNGRLREICVGASDLDEQARQKYVQSWMESGRVRRIDCDDEKSAPERMRPKTRKEKRKLRAENGIRAKSRSGGCCGAAVSFAKTMAKWVADGLKFASEREQQERLDICSECPLNNKGWCTGCGCHLNEKVKLRVSYCPAGKWFVEQPVRPVTGPRNLMMHIMPVAGNGGWQRNVEHLLERIDLFDGKRVIAVLTPEHECKYELDTVEAVQEAFGDARIDEWIVKQNVRRLREGVTWPLLLKSLRKEDGVTFACHAKGATHHRGGEVDSWCDVMWQTCLDDWPSVERALSQYSMAGAFKRYGMFKTRGNHRWHYSGTFYWFRNDDVFGGMRNWHNIDMKFFASESWPGKMFKPEETACLFHEDSGDIYKTREWDNRIWPDFDLWESAR